MNNSAGSLASGYQGAEGAGHPAEPDAAGEGADLTRQVRTLLPGLRP